MRTLCFVLIVIALTVLQGCTTARCDKIRPYQKTKASEPLKVPADLSEPPLRGQSPDVDPDAPTHRADGGCLELPPPFELEEKENPS